MNSALDPRIDSIVAGQPYPLIFATISGAHLYGFASADSDYDLRGAHVLPARMVMGLEPPVQTIESNRMEQGLELDLVTHDAAKFFRLLLRRNGYVLEQLHSPLAALSTPEHEELKAIARRCVTRGHVHHYLGFKETQWKLFAKGNPPHVKPLLYVYRVLLTGIHLMRTGEVESNLPRLNEEFRLPWIDELIARKTGGAEKETLTDANLQFHERECRRLQQTLAEASEKSDLPDEPDAKEALNDLLIRLRARSMDGTAS